ncbi:MAG: hypothetical protein EGQ57_01875 [Alphaproteobacteria bacterium]|nr:hypothetical protein [Alphaproteobacteria bacterium]
MYIRKFYGIADFKASQTDKRLYVFSGGRVLTPAGDRQNRAEWRQRGFAASFFAFFAVFLLLLLKNKFLLLKLKLY